MLRVSNRRREQNVVQLITGQGRSLWGGMLTAAPFPDLQRLAEMK
jgi:hypothetical protein